MLKTAHMNNLWLGGAGVRLHAVAAGDPDGPAVVLLHGFPEYWYGWRHQIAPLAAAGFRVIALDQRGYNLSGKPAKVSDYTTDRLAADVVACLDDLGLRRASIVGHDWGGGIGWTLAALHPDRLMHLVVLNCPHPRAMQVELESNWGQLIRSWYILAAQLPGLPERVAEWTDYRLLQWSMQRSARPGTFTPRDSRRYRRAWSRPGAMTAMVNWYRAAGRYPLALPEARIRVPTLLMWGQRDAFLDRELAPASAAMCDRVRMEVFRTAGHWLLHEEPEQVNQRIIQFLSSTRATL
jgi:pimeloyl-ACP methyl ester carboxylesterase